MSFIAHGDAQLYTVSFGQGRRTLLALGGWAGNWELWTEPFAILSQTWRTVAYDHRGAGATLAPVESIDVPTMADDVIGVMDALQIDRAVLAAESAGAAVALLAALRSPERFNGLVLVDGLYVQPPTGADDPFLLGLRRDFPGTVAGFVDACLNESDPDVLRHWGRRILLGSTPAAAIRLYECMAGIDLRPDISRINLPVLVIHGSADRIVPVESSRWLAAHLPHSELVIIEGAGHTPTVTHSAEVAAAINRRFALLANV